MSRKFSPADEPGRIARVGNESVAEVVALNEEATAYLALAAHIRGAAVDLSPAGRHMLREGLASRFGPILSTNGPDALDELLRLAIEPTAA